LSKERHAYEFGPYRLLPSERLLLREGEPVALAPKAFETLVALVRRAGRLSDKEELLKEVWPDAFVEESNLTQNVFALRRALGPAENGKPYIETVPKRGYRFLAAVTIAEDPVQALAPSQPAEPPEPAPVQPPDPVTRPARSRAMVGTAAIVGVIALIGVAALVVKLSRRPAPVASFDTMKMVRLTTSGKVFNLAISPDGKYVVYGLRDGAQQSLWVRQTATQSVVQIVAPALVSYVGLTFSPDGDFIFYNVASRGLTQRALFRVPTLGGTPVQVLEDLRGGAISVSPDGRQIAFIRVAPGTESVLMIANADGTGARRLVAHKNPPEELDAPAWSPDGKRIAYAVVDHRSNDSGIVEAEVATGIIRPMNARRWLRIIKLAWLSDGRRLLALATPGENFVYQVWQLSYPDGEAQRLTNDLNSYASMSLAAGADTLALTQAATEANIWVAPANDLGRLRAVTSGSGKADGVSSWTPDGRIVYHSTASGTYDIWITRPDGGTPQQLTSNARINQGPAVSPDGRSIVFLSDRTGTPHLWRMNIDGSDQRQLTNGASGEQNPQFSPDGRWLVYRTAFGKPTVWKMPAGGGDAVQLTSKMSRAPIVSPDGTLVAYLYREDDGPFRLAVAPFGGGGPVRTFELPSTYERIIRWTPDGRAVAYLDAPNGVSNIVAQPLDGGAPVPLTSFTADRLLAFAWSPDGKQLALSRGTTGGDVVLIKDFR
jgi:Tol biopolymer transport system component/DNA-binding winged helix-turn-helix (wHTH) protein